ncbi:TPA: GNAT family N-acetyltransferase [Burkholderia vietnamiensis]|uniref:GNAT family N-acetyltransferase n=1 Tax=Burkholderia vietnamiensis TaxID=60552 RepID=UPI0018C570F8|nr:GNAT family N-acetyltransferase [Burkholderia vietnamiensis]MCA8266821.1 GNAT family N-acetyltransferase [Burkholderia vietnamiensis]UKV75428.1 GNAT family N-acetyltransferase [Burkholderia vietnamiensis]HDR8926230.1 GNAT family N-acetyltransferase [Burkholderia vietnamiensis]HDR9213213.1 GNAT family N-acetyltransferase [Burkholderia vietnamiensis]
MADLRVRLRLAMCDETNKHINRLVVIGVGESGTQVAQALFNSSVERGFPQQFAVIPVQKQEDGQLMAVISSDEFVPVDQLVEDASDVAFLILDGVCRSGQTLTAVYSKLAKVSKRVWTYAIAVSADSILIPTWYGCLYEASQYVVLAREGITPNTGLYERRDKSSGEIVQTASPALVLRPPMHDDPNFEVGEVAASMNRYTSDDRFFDSTTRAKNILVLEWNSEPVGFIAFHVDGSTLWIDYIVGCQSHKDKPGIGTALYYHVENYAKMRGCENISLWAIGNMVEWYANRGFTEIAGARKISIGKEPKVESYHPMTHRLLSDMGHYHV